MKVKYYWDEKYPDLSMCPISTDEKVQPYEKVVEIPETLYFRWNDAQKELSDCEDEFEILEKNASRTGLRSK